MSPCICGHEIRDHEWNFNSNPEPCNECKCKNYEEEEDKK